MKVLGLDIGGTFIKILIKQNDNIEKFKVKIESKDKSNSGFLNLLTRIITDHNPDKVGIAIAGLVDRNGLITSSPNLKFTEGLNIKKIVNDKFGIPTFVANDANLAAYGEYVYGNRKSSDILVCLTLGTGLGGGAVIDGKILEGVSGCGMEIGHMIIEKGGKLCNCGRRGCLEAYASSYGLERIYFELSGVKKSSFDIISLAKEGDLEAIRTFELFLDYLSVGIMNVVHIFNPDSVVLSGGMVENYPEIVEKLLYMVKGISFPLSSSKLTIEMAKLGSWSGAFGALAIAENQSS